MPLPAERHISLFRGDDYSHVVQIVDGAGEPVDVSGRTYAAMWRLNAQANDKVSFAIDMTDAAVGKVVLSLTSVQTAGMEDGLFDLQETNESGAIRTLFQGRVTVKKDITRV